MQEDAHLRLRARVIDDTLMLDAQRPEDGMLKGFITISVPDALSVTLSGQGTGMIHGFSGVDKFMIVADNKRRVTAKVSANELRVNAANETNLLLEGQGRSIILSATNRSLINAVDYPVLFSSAIAEENTIIYTNVANTLNASAVKNSIVNYKGNPLNLFTSELESGKVMPID
ncbi:MAG: DUF2807 domain-containing protein [Chitinophagaceae bacterium]|nr:DUF2807 domain-containing protein [Chitinophagaceae bacterium]